MPKHIDGGGSPGLWLIRGEDPTSHIAESCNDNPSESAAVVLDDGSSARSRT